MKRSAVVPSSIIALLFCGMAIAQNATPGVAGSDRYSLHGEKFEAAARELIARGRCKPADFVAVGGFMRSTDASRIGQYFIYCGAITLANRVYISVADEKPKILD